MSKFTQEEINIDDFTAAEQNKLNKLIEKLRAKGNKKTLDLSNKKLTSKQLAFLLPEIKLLNKIRKLSLIGNQITELPKEIGKLSNSYGFDIANNKIAKIPT